MNTLHLFNESPFTNNSFKTAFTFIQKEDGILLTGNAVYALHSSELLSVPIIESSVIIYALEEDIRARQITLNLNTLEIIDYLAFVRLCTKYKKVVTWS